MLNKIVKGIYQVLLPLPYSLQSVNSYLIEGENGYTVIDTGDTIESINVWEQLRKSGIVIEKVILTHTHPDHCGLAGWFQEELQVPVMVSNYSIIELERIKQRYLDGSPLNDLFLKHGGPKLPKAVLSSPSPFDFLPDSIYQHGETIKFGNDSFEAIWTPGHAKDQFCFYNPELQIMMVSDHVLADISPMIELRGEEGENPLQDYFTSLDLIKTYPVKVALTGHGGLIDDLQARIDEIQARQQHRLNQMLDILSNDALSAAQISEMIYKKQNQRFQIEQFMAIITRLLYLESIGKVNSKQQNGKVYYQAIG
ncbi:MBL fold metallo-hydrolase [Neobacillus vireti]|uniref:MBL fold metallo-hydrolase n=1 Tax=Neobacillus vireti TaxID=220686 RepID=UPI002FFDDA57